MPAKKPDKHPRKPAPATDRIVRWPNPNKKKDDRGPWLYGMVLKERTHALTVQILDFAWRDAWDLTTRHLSWSADVYEMEGRRGLHDLVTLTMDGRDDEKEILPGTEEDGYSHEGLRPLDTFDRETVKLLTSRYKGFVWLAIRQLWSARAAASEGRPALLKRRSDRFYETILPTAVEKHLTWWKIIILLEEASGLDRLLHKSVTPFQMLAAYPKTQDLIIERVYWPLLSCRQAQRARYKELYIRTRIPKDNDELARGVKRLYRKFSCTTDPVQVIHPETWEETVWQRLQTHFRLLHTDSRVHMFRDHWQQPYFPRLLKGCLDGLIQSVGAAKACETVSEEIRQIIAEHARLLCPNWMNEAEKLLPGLKAP